MRVLFSTWPAHGHLLPLIPLARAAERAGHDVIVASGTEGVAEARRRGLDTWEIGPSRAEADAAFRAEMPDLAPSAPADVTVSGYTGKQIDITAPDYASGECRANQFGLWRVPSDPSDSADSPGYWAQGPRQHNRMWILDVDGTRLVIGATYLPSASPQERATLDEVMASLQIG